MSGWARSSAPQCWGHSMFSKGITALQLLCFAPSMQVGAVGSSANWILKSDGAMQQQHEEPATSHLMRAEPPPKSTSGNQIAQELMVEMMEMGSLRLIPGLQNPQVVQASQPGSSQPASGSILAEGRPEENLRTGIKKHRKSSRAKRHSRGRRTSKIGSRTSHRLHHKQSRSPASMSTSVLPGRDEDPEDPAIVTNEERKEAAKAEANWQSAQAVSPKSPASVEIVDEDELVLPGQPGDDKPIKANSSVIKEDESEDSNATDDGRKGGFQANSTADEFKAAHRDYAWKHGHDSRDGVSDDWNEEDAEPSQLNRSADDGFGDTGDDDFLPDNGDVEIDDGSVINITSEKDASAKVGQQPLKAADTREPKIPPHESDIMKLGEGIGAMAYERSPSGSRNVDHALEKRLKMQDYATLSMLMVVFTITILLSCCSVYQVAEDPSPAKYYSEPRHYQQRLISETGDLYTFLAAFNLQPQNIRLRIIGRNPEPGGFRRFLRSLNPHTIRPRGLAALLPSRQRRRLAVLFDVSLDLTPFIAGEGRLNDDNLSILQKYLSSKNSLETMLLQKRVDWVHWEDVATNVRQRLRTLGFPGDVEVHFEAYDEVLVYKNHRWSNFVRNRVTQALVVISMVGAFFWLPYVWVRQKRTTVETRFRIDLDPSRYWELVSDGLSAAEGFQNT